MSLIPEFIFRAAIVRGFRALRQDSRLADQLFRNLDQESAAEMRDFIQKNRINLDINYPRTTLALPAIIILLRNEDESQAFLGDGMGLDSVPNEFTYPDYETSELEILGGATNVSTTSGYAETVFGPYPVASATNNTLKIASDSWCIDEFRVGGHEVSIIGGTGTGQTRKVTANTPNTLMVDKNWDTNPDNTSAFVVKKTQIQEVIGEPRSLYKQSQTHLIERLGSMYNLNYQIQVITANSEQTVYLHALVKSILTLARTFLEGQGVINMRLGATDFVPRPEYQPDFAYMRAVNVNFQYPFDIFSELTGLATSFNVYLEKDDVELSPYEC